MTDAVADSPPAGPPSGAPPGGWGTFALAPRKADGEINWVLIYVGFGAMVLGQFMAMLDIQIVASSLPQIQAGIGASADEVSWIQTAYLIPEVVMIPLAGFLSRLFGTQKVFMVSCVGFTAMSVLTGFSSDIDMMIITRALQGFIGGAMIPTVFAITFVAFPPERRTTATTIMGLIVTLAPTLGPTLGGHITEALSWRWLFFINVVPGAVVTYLVWRFGRFDEGDARLAKGFDWWGLGLMASFLMSLEYVLEKGAADDWFADDRILWLTVLAVVSGGSFIWRQLVYRNPIVQLRCFGDRNFTIGILMNFVNGASIFSGTFLIPLYLGRIRGYSAAQIGTTMLISGLTMFIVAPIAGRIVRRYDSRISLVIGFVLSGAGLWTGHAISAQWGFPEFAALQAMRSGGSMLAMIAAQMMAISTLSPALAQSGSGLINLARNVGGAVGLAVLSTLLTHQVAEHMNDLAAAVTLSDPQAQGMLAGLAQRMASLGVADPAAASRAAFQFMLNRQAQILSYADCFSAMAAACIVAAALGMTAKSAPPQNWSAPPKPVEAH